MVSISEIEIYTHHGQARESGRRPNHITGYVRRRVGHWTSGERQMIQFFVQYLTTPGDPNGSKKLFSLSFSVVGLPQRILESS